MHATGGYAERQVDVATAGGSLSGKWGGIAARPDQEKRHDDYDPAASGAFFRRGFGRRFAKAPDAAAGQGYRGRHGQIRRAAVPQPGYYRRTADGVRAEFRRAGKSARQRLAVLAEVG